MRMPKSLWSLCLLLLLAGPSAAQIELGSLLRPAFPSEPVASRDGESLAWLENAAGARSVWLARAPEWTPRRLAEFGGDDGLELSALALSGDGRWLAFVRGGDEGGAPETNAASAPGGAQAGVWLVDAAGNKPARCIGDGFAPQFSPVVDRLLFLRAGQLWSAKLPGKKEKEKNEPRQLTHLRGQIGSYRLAPDGGRIAFTSQRDTHGFVGVLEIAAERITWLDPGVDTDLFPTWSPNGQEVAFLRLPASDEPPSFVPHRSASEPWSLRVASATTGAGREVFRAAAGDGSAFHAFETQNENLWWTADGQLVFPWEKNGWHHLWSVPAAGGAAREWTPCACELEHVTLDAAGKTFYFTSNEGQLDHRRLYRVAAGSAPERLDQGEERFEFYPQPLAGGAIAFLESAAGAPLALTWRDPAGATRPLRPAAVPADFPAAALRAPREVVFPSTDGLPIHGQLFLPLGGPEAPRPAVVFVHGGPPRQMFAAFHPMGYYHQAYAVNQWLASHGFVVLSINYRSGIGYGLAFREADGVGEAGASEFQDVLAAAIYLRSQPEVDGEKIGIWGGSYGGYLTALALARASGTFKAGVDFHGVHDWNLEFPAPPFTRTYVATGARLDRAYDASPIADVATWRSPVLLIHGDDDHNVPFVETVRLAEALRRQGVPFETLIFPDEVHGFFLHRSWLRSYAATLDFLQRKLGSKP